SDSACRTVRAARDERDGWPSWGRRQTVDVRVFTEEIAHTPGASRARHRAKVKRTNARDSWTVGNLYRVENAVEERGWINAGALGRFTAKPLRAKPFVALYTLESLLLRPPKDDANPPTPFRIYRIHAFDLVVSMEDRAE